MWNGFFHASCSSLSVVFHKDKKHSQSWVSSWHLQTTDLFHLLFSFPVSLLLKDPPELHSAELLTFCSSFVFVPFVSVTERESVRVQTGRMRRHVCVPEEDGWVGLRGGGHSKRARGSRSSGWAQGEGLVGSDRAGEVKEDCHRNDVRDKAIIP